MLPGVIFDIVVSLLCFHLAKLLFLSGLFDLLTDVLLGELEFIDCNEHNDGCDYEK